MRTLREIKTVRIPCELEISAFAGASDDAARNPYTSLVPSPLMLLARSSMLVLALVLQGWRWERTAELSDSGWRMR